VGEGEKEREEWKRARECLKGKEIKQEKVGHRIFIRKQTKGGIYVIDRW